MNFSPNFENFIYFFLKKKFCVHIKWQWYAISTEYIIDKIERSEREREKKKEQFSRMKAAKKTSTKCERNNPAAVVAVVISFSVVARSDNVYLRHAYANKTNECEKRWAYIRLSLIRITLLLLLFDGGVKILLVVICWFPIFTNLI